MPLISSQLSEVNGFIKFINNKKKELVKYLDRPSSRIKAKFQSPAFKTRTKLNLRPLINVCGLHERNFTGCTFWILLIFSCFDNVKASFTGAWKKLPNHLNQPQIGQRLYCVMGKIKKLSIHILCINFASTENTGFIKLCGITIFFRRLSQSYVSHFNQKFLFFCY